MPIDATRYDKKMSREKTLCEILRAVDEAIGVEPPHRQAVAIIAAIKGMRSTRPVFNPSTDRVDYLDMVQKAGQRAWRAKHQPEDIGPQHDVITSVETPLGWLKIITWRKTWEGDAKGERIVWLSEYYLNEGIITVAEIKLAGLARRPTTRNKRRRVEN